MVGSIPGSLAGSWTFGVRVNRAYRTNTHVHADLNNIMMLYTVYFFYLSFCWSPVLRKEMQ